MTNLIDVTPMFNRIITTMDVYEDDQYTNGLIDTTKAKGTIKEYQKVISVGTSVRDIKVGDTVCIDPTRYMVTKHNDKALKNNLIGDQLTIGFKFNTIKLDGKEHLVLFDQDITFIVNKYEEVEDKKPKIVQLDKPSIIV